MRTEQMSNEEILKLWEKGLLFGNRLRKIRKEKGFTLQQLASLSNTSKAYLSQLENNQSKKPSVYKTFDLADALGVTINELVGRNNL